MQPEGTELYLRALHSSAPLDIIAKVEPAQELLAHPGPQSHFVQFYGIQDEAINRNVARYLAEGLGLEGGLVIGSQERNSSVFREINDLGVDAAGAQAEGRLCFLDAEETLAQFMVDGQPYWRRFERTIGNAINNIRESVGHGGLRAYGEMVGVLWTQGHFSAAVRLEQFWNRLLSRSSASLFCGYPIDILSPAFCGEGVDAVLCAHSHVLSSDISGDMESAISKAIHNVLGAAAIRVETALNDSRQRGRAGMPRTEAGILWIRKNLPDRASEILAQARQFLRAVRPETAS